MATLNWLTNHLLIAMPALQDPNFHRSVTYICQHNEQGAMGLVINRGADLSFTDVLRQMRIDAQAEQLDQVQVLIGKKLYLTVKIKLHNETVSVFQLLSPNNQYFVTLLST